MKDVRTILLVEPDLALREFFIQIFINAGHNPIFIEDEERIDSLTANEALEVDLVIIDDSRSPKTFVSALAEICANANRKRIPVIGLLNKGGLLSETTESHFDEILVKDNFNISIFMDCVDDLLR